jgi:hypothetical protein
LYIGPSNSIYHHHHHHHHHRRRRPSSGLLRSVTTQKTEQFVAWAWLRLEIKEAANIDKMYGPEGVNMDSKTSSKSIKLTPANSRKKTQFYKL